jgi:hypothetical protein
MWCERRASLRATDSAAATACAQAPGQPDVLAVLQQGVRLRIREPPGQAGHALVNGLVGLRPLLRPPLARGLGRLSQ